MDVPSGWSDLSEQSIIDRFGSPPYRLNVGCGMDMRADCINVDAEFAACADIRFDLEEHPWPLPSGTVSYILARHVLEHIRDLRTFFTEAYRVMIPGSIMEIEVPHHCSDFFWGDPTHVRPITHAALSLMGRKVCQKFIDDGMSNTPLAIYWGIDFVLDETVEVGLSDRWREKLHTSEAAKEAMATFNNVATEMKFKLVRGE